MKNIVLLGLPGLYQNWLMAAVDPHSKLQLHGTQNFFCAKSVVKWVIKIQIEDYPEADEDLIVLNLAVHEKNMPWYLYNLFEKTYDINVRIDSFVEDIIDKGTKFSIFNLFRDKILQIDYRDQNEIIYFFYKFFVDKDSFLYKYCPVKNNKYINIEYDDFGDPALLQQKLSSIPNFSEDHFNKLYESLAARNQRYLNRKQDFLEKLEKNTQLDVIELGYVGSLVAKLYNKDINWKDEKIRNQVLKHRLPEIKDLALSLC